MIDFSKINLPFSVSDLFSSTMSLLSSMSGFILLIFVFSISQIFVNFVTISLMNKQQSTTQKKKRKSTKGRKRSSSRTTSSSTKTRKNLKVV